MPALKQTWLNLVADHRYRGQANAMPATWYIGLLRGSSFSRSSADAELSTGGGDTGYARQGIAANLTNFSGTQGPGTTAVSSGSNDYISNNVTITFAASLTAAWANVTAFGLFDALSGGNHREWGQIVDTSGNPITRSYAVGDEVVFAPGSLRLYLR